MKTKVNLTTKLRNSFRGLDMFGQDVKFNMRGVETINSTYGAWLSLAIYFTLVAYAMIRWDVYYYNKGTLNAEIVMKDHLDPSVDYFDFEVKGFQIAFGVRNYLERLPRHDPAYVEFVV